MIYVDDPMFPYKGSLYCHMMSGAEDESLDELHAMAATIGLKRSWFQDKPGFPHYDLAPAKRRAAIRAGAIAVSSPRLIELCKRGIK